MPPNQRDSLSWKHASKSRHIWASALQSLQWWHAISFNFFVPERFDRHLLFENVKEQLVKRWHLIIDLVWNTDSALGGLWDVYAKGLCVKVLKTISHYGGRNRFWMLQSLVNRVTSSQHSYARIRKYSYVLSIIFPYMPLHENGTISIIITLKH